MATPLLAYFVLLSVWLVITVAARFLTWWRYRHLPGNLPLFGDLLVFVKLGLPRFLDLLTRRYGSIFKVWLGPKPCVVVSDPRIGRSILLRNMNRQRVLRDPLATGAEAEINTMGLATCRADKWRMLHAAWAPTFSTASLSGYLPLMDDCAQQLCRCVLDMAATSGQVIDIWRELGRMTLQVVGSTAYGVDFHTLDKASGPQGEAARLVNACQQIFRLGGIGHGSIYATAAFAVPELVPLLAFLAKRFPDKHLMQLTEARSILRQQCQALIDSWRATHKTEEEGSLVDLAPEGATLEEGTTEHRVPTKGVPAVKPGSFLGLMLAARDRDTGEKLTDIQIIAQANTFLLAGYETTANALAYTIYCLCCNEEAEEKLVKEVDMLGRGQPLTMDSLEKLSYTGACISEALRLYPPATATGREAKADMMIGDYLIPKGTPLLVPINNFHHDPELWPAPQRFIPERFLEVPTEFHPRAAHAYLPFGAGSRMCIGSRFAIQEAKVCLARVYQQYRFRLEAGQIPLQTVTRLTTAPKNGVRVTVHKRE